MTGVETCTIKGSEKHSKYHGIIIIIRSFIHQKQGKEPWEVGSQLIISQETSHHIARRGGENASCNSATTTHLSRRHHPRSPGLAWPGPYHRGLFSTFDYTPFPFQFFPTGLKALQTRPSVASVADFVHIRHVHAFLRRYNTTTTWFGSDAVAGRCRSEAGPGGSVGNSGHRRSIWLASSENVLSDIISFSSSLFPFHGADNSLPSFRLPDKSPHYPSSKERASGITCSEKGVFISF